MNNIKYTARRYGVDVTVSPEVAAEIVLTGQEVKARIVGIELPHLVFELQYDPDPAINNQYVHVGKITARDQGRVLYVGIGQIAVHGKTGEFWQAGKTKPFLALNMEDAITHFVKHELLEPERTPALEWRGLSTDTFGLALFVNDNQIYSIERGELQDHGEYNWEVWQDSSKLICVCDDIEDATNIAELLASSA